MKSYWYLAQLRPNQLQRAVTNLERQQFAVFMPRIVTVSKVRNRMVSRQAPLFPGYLFVQCDWDRPRWSAIASTYGVARLVSLDPRGPTPVPQAIIDGLMEDCDPEGLIRPPEDLMPGEVVKLRSGIFFGREGTVERLTDQDRVMILLDCMGRRVRLDLPRGELARIGG